MATYTTTCANLNTLLQGLAANTPDTPYDIEITDLGGYGSSNSASNMYFTSGTNSNTASLQYALQQNPTKYVDLSSSIVGIRDFGTFTTANRANAYMLSLGYLYMSESNVTTIIKGPRFAENVMLYTYSTDGSDISLSGLTNVKELWLPKNVKQIYLYSNICTNRTNDLKIHAWPIAKDYVSLYNNTWPETVDFDIYIYTNCTSSNASPLDDKPFIHFIVMDHETTAANLDTLLKSLPANTPDNPYTIEITDIQSFVYYSDSRKYYLKDYTQEGSLGYILYDNPTKYVDLSENTLYVDYASDSFTKCKSLIKAPDIRPASSSTIHLALAFSDCINLKSANIFPYTKEFVDGNNVYTDILVTSLDMNAAFSNCKKLEAVGGLLFIPSDFSNWWVGTFTYCLELKKLYFYIINDISNVSTNGSIVSSAYSQYLSVMGITTNPDFIYTGMYLPNEYDNTSQYYSTFETQHYVTTFANLDTLLQGLNENNMYYPYSIKISDPNSIPAGGVTYNRAPTSGKLQYILLNNSLKYISLASNNYLYTGNLQNANDYFCCGCTNIVYPFKIYDENTPVSFYWGHSTAGMFSYCTSLIETCDVYMKDCAYYTQSGSGSSLFAVCISLKRAGYIRVAFAAYMFNKCFMLKHFKTLEIYNGFEGSTSTYHWIDGRGFPRIFGQCRSLKYIYLYGNDNATDNILKYNYLKETMPADLSSYDYMNTGTEYLLYDCTSLQHIYPGKINNKTTYLSTFVTDHLKEYCSFNGWVNFNANHLYDSCYSLTEANMCFYNNASNDTIRLSNSAAMFKGLNISDEWMCDFCEHLEMLGNSDLFISNRNMVTLNFKNLTEYSNYSGDTISNCNNLENILMPKLEKIVLCGTYNPSYGGTLAYNCTKLKGIIFPELTSIQYNSGGGDPMIKNCKNMDYIEFPKLTTVSAYGPSTIQDNFNMNTYYCLMYPWPKKVYFGKQVKCYANGNLNIAGIRSLLNVIESGQPQPWGYKTEFLRFNVANTNTPAYYDTHFASKTMCCDNTDQTEYMKVITGNTVPMSLVTFTKLNNKKYKALSIGNTDIHTYAIKNKTAWNKVCWDDEAQFKVNFDTFTNGTVASQSNRYSIESTVTLTVTPDSGYELDSISVEDINGSTVTLTTITQGTEYTFEMPQGAVTVHATFTQETQTGTIK